MRPWWLLALGLLGCADGVSSAGEAVVYGVDGRTEVYAHANAALQAVARSAIAMKIRAGFVDETDPSDVRINYTRTLSVARNLCPGEPFEDQIEPGTCSGTLIDSQHILTAGHCMDAPADCTDYAWLLGFRYEAAGVLATLTSDDVYRCGAVVASFNDSQVDYAVVRLSRPVVGHTPASVRMEASALPYGTDVALIGHPNGIPMKIDSGGVVTWSSAAATWFRATVDAFNGNSGSGTFDQSGNLVGVLGGGETDYVDRGGCNVVNVIDPPPTDDGERLVYVRPALEALCAVPGVASPLCDCGGEPCVAGPDYDRCPDAEPIPGESQVIEDTLTGYAPWERGSCGGNGPERIYTFTLSESARLVATSEGFDTVLYLRGDACDGDEIVCDDDIMRPENTGSRINAGLLAGTYFLFVDAYDGAVGDFTLTIELTPRGTDAGLPDAGPPPAPDASVEPDAGPPIVPPPEGCACRAAPREGARWPLWLLALGLLRRRRACS